MDTGKDQPPPKREPRVLDDIEVRDAQQEALSTLGKRFIGTPLGIVFMDENFTGTREYKSGLSRNYHATRTANEYGDEIILTSTIKRSDTKKRRLWWRHTQNQEAWFVIRKRTNF